MRNNRNSILIILGKYAEAAEPAAEGEAVVGDGEKIIKLNQLF